MRRLLSIEIWIEVMSSYFCNRNCFSQFLEKFTNSNQILKAKLFQGKQNFSQFLLCFIILVLFLSHINYFIPSGHKIFAQQMGLNNHQCLFQDFSHLFNNAKCGRSGAIRNKKSTYIFIHIMSHKNGHLSSFTSIISLLSVKHPQSQNQFSILRTAVTQWHNSVCRVIEEKNIEIMNAKTKGTEQLRAIFQEMEHYMQTMGQYYKDPNMSIFRKKFKKIKEIILHQFMDNYGTKEVQTDPVEHFLPGFDTNKLIKLLEQREDQNRYLQTKIGELEAQILALHSHLKEIEDQRKKEENQYAGKLEKLRVLLETTQKKPPTSSEQIPPNSYRSYPEVKKFSTEKKLSSRVREAFDEAENEQQERQKMEKQESTGHLLKIAVPSNYDESGLSNIRNFDYLP